MRCNENQQKERDNIKDAVNKGKKKGRYTGIQKAISNEEGTERDTKERALGEML